VFDGSRRLGNWLREDDRWSSVRIVEVGGLHKSECREAVGGLRDTQQGRRWSWDGHQWYRHRRRLWGSCCWGDMEVDREVITCRCNHHHGLWVFCYDNSRTITPAKKRSRRDIPRGNMKVPTRAFLGRGGDKHALTSAKVTWVWIGAPVLRGVESWRRSLRFSSPMAARGLSGTRWILLRSFCRSVPPKNGESRPQSHLDPLLLRPPNDQNWSTKGHTNPS
jgi:hypothetical protein